MACSKLPVAVTRLRPGEQKAEVLYRCSTVHRAEQWIAVQEDIDPEGVHRGWYSINAPEEMINPRRGK